jgi:hypothetical protein
LIIDGGWQIVCNAPLVVDEEPEVVSSSRKPCDGGVDCRRPITGFIEGNERDKWEDVLLFHELPTLPTIIAGAGEEDGLSTAAPCDFDGLKFIII